MAKIIAICGSPNSGKTTVAFKLAQEVYVNTSDCPVIYLSPSLVVPALGMIFPNYTPDSLYSLGELLDRTDICEEDVLNHLVTVKNMKNFGCLGYKVNENRYSFAKPTKDKVNMLFETLSNMAGYVFVECTEDENDLISLTALSLADEIVFVLSPDLKGMTYYTANKEFYGSNEERSHKVINITDNELYLPVEDVKAQLKDVVCTLPFSRQVRQQLLDGLLYERATDKKYRKEITNLVNKTI